MARAFILVCCLIVIWPILASADNVAPLFSGKYLLPLASELPGLGTSVLPGNDLLALGVEVPSDQTGLMSPLAASHTPATCLPIGTGAGSWNGCATPAGADLVDATEPAHLKSADDDLKLVLLFVILLGSLKYFLASPFYAALWERVLSPLTWE